MCSGSCWPSLREANCKAHSSPGSWINHVLHVFLIPRFSVFVALCEFWVPFGIHLACFLECLGTLKIKPDSWREYDSHTLDLLFSGPISRPEFAADFSKTFCILSISGLHLGGLLDPFGWKMEVLKKRSTKNAETSFPRSYEGKRPGPACP